MVVIDAIWKHVCYMEKLLDAAQFDALVFAKILTSFWKRLVIETFVSSPLLNR